MNPSLGFGKNAAHVSVGVSSDYSRSFGFIQTCWKQKTASRFLSSCRSSFQSDSEDQERQRPPELLHQRQLHPGTFLRRVGFRFFHM